MIRDKLRGMHEHQSCPVDHLCGRFVHPFYNTWAGMGVAIIARSLSGGFKSAAPLAFGVAIGDVLWSIFALIGVAYLVSLYADILILFCYVASGLLILMGAALVRWPNAIINENSKLTTPGVWAGLIAGLAVVIANPKASLFYLAFLPNLFDFTHITTWDMIAISTVSFFVPLAGNLMMAMFMGRMRRFLASPEAMRKTNITAGIALILVGLVIGVV